MDTLQSEYTQPKTAFEEQVAAMNPWFHNLHLPEGQTAPNHPLGDFPRFKWEGIAPHLPDSLNGWTALDVGCNAGYYSFELASRGAAVQAIDVDARYLKQASWAAAKLSLQDRVSFKQQSVYEVARDPATYDIVWFMGVFYHLRYPVLALDLLARKARRLFVFQSLTCPQPERRQALPDNLPYDQRHRLTSGDWPSMAFIEKRLAGDPTNWWAASPDALEALLRTAGLRVLARPDEETFVCEPAAQTEETEERQLAERERDAVLAAFGAY